MGLRQWLRPRLIDLAMRRMDELRPDTVCHAEGNVVEIGFGTGLNLTHYGPGVKSVVGVDPEADDGFAATDERVARAGFPVERAALRADETLPFEDARFDTALSTWTLCSIPDPVAALREVQRVLKPGGSFLFVEHGRAEDEGTARWQDRLDPYWTVLADGCHINRRIDSVVSEAGLEVVSLERFRFKGPGILAAMYRGVARRAG